MRLAEILAAHWPAYRAQFGRLIPAEQHAAVRATLRCRTPALGGQRHACACGREHFAYHSCNHQRVSALWQDDAAHWLAQQRTRLLPVPCFLVTCTVPEQLREPIRAAMKAWYGALQDLAADPKHLGAELGRELRWRSDNVRAPLQAILGLIDERLPAPVITEAKPTTLSGITNQVQNDFSDGGGVEHAEFLAAKPGKINQMSCNHGWARIDRSKPLLQPPPWQRKPP